MKMIRHLPFRTILHQRPFLLRSLYYSKKVVTDNKHPDTPDNEIESPEKVSPSLPNSTSPTPQSNTTSTAPAEEEFIEGHPYFTNYQQLVESGFSPELSKTIIISLDKITQDKVSALVAYYLSKQEYESILKIYHTGMDRFHTDSKATQKGHFESVRKQYDHLNENISTVHDGILDQVKALESALQLDVTLEKKKIAESVKLVNQLASQEDSNISSKMMEVMDSIKNIRRQTTTTVAGKILFS